VKSIILIVVLTVISLSIVFCIFRLIEVSEFCYETTVALKTHKVAIEGVVDVLYEQNTLNDNTICAIKRIESIIDSMEAK